MSIQDELSMLGWSVSPNHPASPLLALLLEGDYTAVVKSDLAAKLFDASLDVSGLLR